MKLLDGTRPIAYSFNILMDNVVMGAGCADFCPWQIGYTNTRREFTPNYHQKEIAMASIAPPPQSDALEQNLLAHLQVPEPTLRALRRARELERELVLLRSTLTDSSTSPLPKAAKHEQVANLLSRVVLFRAALVDPLRQDVTVPGPGQTTEQI